MLDSVLGSDVCAVCCPLCLFIKKGEKTGFKAYFTSQCLVLWEYL